MGEHSVKTTLSETERATFVRHLLDDIQSLEYMLENNMIESGITRIGAEQEFCLVDKNWRPSLLAEEVLKDVNDEHFTTELARYNLEINLDPLELKGDCFQQMTNQLTDTLAKAKKVAASYSSSVVLTGILPTISKNELEFNYMTPNPRYWALNDIIKQLRGSDFELHIKGVDELTIAHDSVLFEACNTSFQMHLQIDPDDFISSYNWAQAISGPLLSVCTNSPLLLGRELWNETRIALFQQSIDMRSSSYALKDQQARVTFGDSWAEGSIAEIFKNEIARYKVILAKDIASSSLDIVKNGGIPKLEALNLHNGTIYRWNRPCYGTGGGKAHVRIENRYIPSGPTVVDEIANFVFWVGLMQGRPKRYDDMRIRMDFRDVKSNFIKAARYGKETMLSWENDEISATELLTEVLMPIARDGLEQSGIDIDDINYYLDIVEKRALGTTGSQWKTRNYRTLHSHMKQDDALLTLTKHMYDLQWKDIPVHEWPMIEDPSSAHEAAHLITHVMSTQLFTVNENDLAELATSIMKWKNIHHVPVEGDDGKLRGLLTWTHMKNFTRSDVPDPEMTVKQIMVQELHIASPEMEIQEAIALMKKHEIGCLPVLMNDQLVGVVTIKDLLPYDND